MDYDDDDDVLILLVVFVDRRWLWSRKYCESKEKKAMAVHASGIHTRGELRWQQGRGGGGRSGEDMAGWCGRR